MKKEVEIFGFKFPYEAIFDEDGKMKVLGCLIYVAYVSSFLRWLSEHPDILKEIAK